MTPQMTETGTESTLATYEARILSQINDADARLEQFEALAKGKRGQAHTAAIAAIKAAKQRLEANLRDLATTSEVQISRAKTDIDAAAVALKTALDALGRKLSAISGTTAPRE